MQICRYSRWLGNCVEPLVVAMEFCVTVGQLIDKSLCTKPAWALKLRQRCLFLEAWTAEMHHNVLILNCYILL